MRGRRYVLVQVVRRRPQWSAEVFVDWSTWLLGVNWFGLDASGGCYLHMGPIAFGVYR